MVFEKYSELYNVFNSEKDYKTEIEFITEIINKNLNKTKLDILDLGCGTGIHSKLLSDMGHNVVGVDISEGMIEIAKKNSSKNEEYFIHDIVDFRLKKKFDVVLSLFHVFSYQVNNENISGFFKTIKCHLKDNGIAIFDYWHTSAVMSIIPSNRVSRKENHSTKYIRICEPEILPKKNIVNVNYEFIIIDKLTSKADVFYEVHPMRHFSIPEINFFLKNENLRLITSHEWLTYNEPSIDTWSLFSVIKK